MGCFICGTELTAPWSDDVWLLPVNQREFRYRECLQCGTIFSDPLPTVQELRAFYGEHFNYHWYEERLPFKRIQAAHRWRRTDALLRRYGLAPKRLLDIGCGHGLFVAAARKGGVDAVGVDYPSLATRHAREQLGLEVVEGDLRTMVAQGLLPPSRFDLVTAWHCLEHDTDPLACLRSMNRLLAPAGKLLVAVPNAEAFGMRRRRESWIWCQQPYVHLVHFTEKSLKLLAGQAGLRVLEVWTRDTWDANRAYDVYAAPQARRLSRFLRPFSGRAAFWLEEGCRMAGYLAGCHEQWLFNREAPDMQGSELLLLAELAQ